MHLKEMCVRNIISLSCCDNKQTETQTREKGRIDQVLKFVFLTVLFYDMMHRFMRCDGESEEQTLRRGSSFSTSVRLGFCWQQTSEFCFFQSTTPVFQMFLMLLQILTFCFSCLLLMGQNRILNLNNIFCIINLLVLFSLQWISITSRFSEPSVRAALGRWDDFLTSISSVNRRCSL